MPGGEADEISLEAVCLADGEPFDCTMRDVDVASAFSLSTDAVAENSLPRTSGLTLMPNWPTVALTVSSVFWRIQAVRSAGVANCMSLACCE